MTQERSQKLLDKLLRTRGLTPNVPPFERQVYNDGKRAVAPAGKDLRALAQNIIDQVDEHRHLRTARVLLLVESSEATAKKLAKGERVCIGRAYRSSPIQRVLSSSLASEAEQKKPKGDTERRLSKELDPPLPGFDFIVKLCGDWLEMVGYFAGEESGIKSAAALIDHELLHCGVKIAGEFVERARLGAMVKDLGDLHVETCDDMQDDEGRILVRYQVRDEAGRFAWKLRQHDLEEFCGVVDRWGAWKRDVGELVDVVIKRKDSDAAPLLASAEKKAG